MVFCRGPVLAISFATLLSTLAVLVPNPLARADDKPAPTDKAAKSTGLEPGNWVVGSRTSPSLEQRQLLFKISTEGGKTTAEILAPEGAPKGYFKVVKTEVTDTKVFMELNIGGNVTTIEGYRDPKNPKIILGTLGDERRISPISLSFTDIEEINQQTSINRLTVPDEMASVTKMSSKVAVLRGKMSREKDADAKKELKAELEAATKEADDKMPGMYAEVISKNPRTLSAYQSALTLLRMAEKSKATSSQIQEWALAASDAAAVYGPRWVDETSMVIAQTISSQNGEGYAKIALTYLEPVVKKTEGRAPAARLRVLTVLKDLQTKLGDTTAASATEQTIAKIDGELDAEYLKTVPPFKTRKFAGRTDPKANRVAVMELFTGAQCPPCVAADVAFDALVKTYTPKDVILLQYHVHIPGPDPLTNQDAVARMAFYADKFPGDVRGTPSTLFNGKAQAGGGGGMANSESKFKQYSKIVDEILEETTEASVSATAGRDGDTIKLVANLGGVKASDGLKVRAVLVEENISYTGSNGLRFHHHVVRSFFGKLEGVALKDLPDAKWTTTLSVPKLKSELADYLKTYEKDRPFPNSKRPLDLKNLSVVVLVQNDESGEIVAATQVELSEKTASAR